MFGKTDRPQNGFVACQQNVRELYCLQTAEIGGKCTPAFRLEKSISGSYPVGCPELSAAPSISLL